MATAGELINHCRTLMGDPEGDYHTDAKMLLHVNTALEDISTRSRTMCQWEYIAVSEGQGMYGLPEGYLEAKYVAFYYYGRLNELVPGAISDTAPAIFRDTTIQRIPYHYSDGGIAYTEKLYSTVVTHPTNPNFDTSGEVNFLSETPSIHIEPGDRLINITDGSEGNISEVNSFTQFTFIGLSGGEDNRMEVGDEFRILSQTQTARVIAISPPPTKDDTDGNESLYIYHARQHLFFSQDNIDNYNDQIELDVEFNTAIRNRVLYYMSVDQNGIDHQMTIAFDIKFETDYARAFPKANRRIRQYISTWRLGGNRIPPRKTIQQEADWSVRIPY